jgi:chromosomal replication initiation ATPase DnaA
MTARDIIHVYPETAAQKRDRVLRDICYRHDVTLAHLAGPSRRKDIIPARHEAYYRLKDEAGLSFPRIGAILGGRDHSTIIHGARKHAARHGLPGVSSKS